MSEPALAAGQSDALATPHFFLKIEGIKGDARDTTNHQGEIEVMSWSWGEKQNYTFKDKTGGSVVMRAVTVETVTGMASAQLAQCCCSGKRLKSAVLSCDKEVGKDTETYLTITLSEVVISSYDIIGAPDRQLTTDRFTLDYLKFQFEYVTQKAGTSGGNISFEFALPVNK
jgi:type VI secretion system secreted protein Hcp